MTFETMTLSLPTDLVGMLRRMALDGDETVDHLVRGMLDREATRLRSRRATLEARAHRVARLRHLLAPEMARATGWAELLARLALYGVDLRQTDGALMLHDRITGEALCDAAALGFSARDLDARFGGALAEARRPVA